MKTDRNPGSLRAHFSAVTVHAVEERLLLIAVTFALRGHKCAAVAQGVKLPDAAAVIGAEAFHPGEDMWFEGDPLWDVAEVLRPDAETLLIRDEGGCQHGRGVISNRLRQYRGVSLRLIMSVMLVFPCLFIGAGMLVQPK